MAFRRRRSVGKRYNLTRVTWVSAEVGLPQTIFSVHTAAPVNRWEQLVRVHCCTRHVRQQNWWLPARPNLTHHSCYRKIVIFLVARIRIRTSFRRSIYLDLILRPRYPAGTRGFGLKEIRSLWKIWARWMELLLMIRSGSLRGHLVFY